MASISELYNTVQPIDKFLSNRIINFKLNEAGYWMSNVQIFSIILFLHKSLICISKICDIFNLKLIKAKFSLFKFSLQNLIYDCFRRKIKLWVLKHYLQIQTYNLFGLKFLQSNVLSIFNFIYTSKFIISLGSKYFKVKF